MSIKSCRIYLALFLVATTAWSFRVIAANGEPEPKVRKIPLGSIYSNNSQDGLIAINRSFDITPDGDKKYRQPYGKTLHVMFRNWYLGTSNVFLVRGDDITAAIKATSLVYLASRPGHLCPGPEDGKQHEKIWVAVYFGSGPSNTDSNSGLWHIRSVEVKGKEIRINYATGKRSGNRDMQHYCAWIPLGELEEGKYFARLVDVVNHEITMMRQVRIERK